MSMQRTTLDHLKMRREIAYMIWSSELWDIGRTPSAVKQPTSVVPDTFKLKDWHDEIHFL